MKYLQLLLHYIILFSIYNIVYSMNLSITLHNDTYQSINNTYIQNNTNQSIILENKSTNNTNSSNDAILSSCLAVGILLLFFLSMIFCKCTSGNKCYIDYNVCPCECCTDKSMV